MDAETLLVVLKGLNDAISAGETAVSLMTGSFGP